MVKETKGLNIIVAEENGLNFGEHYLQRAKNRRTEFRFCDFSIYASAVSSTIIIANPIIAPIVAKSECEPF